MRGLSSALNDTDVLRRASLISRVHVTVSCCYNAVKFDFGGTLVKVKVFAGADTASATFCFVILIFMNMDSDKYILVSMSDQQRCYTCTLINTGRKMLFAVIKQDDWTIH